MTINDIKPQRDERRGRGRRGGRPSWRARVGVGVGAVVAVLGLAALATGAGRALLSGGEEEVRTVRVPAPPPLKISSDTLEAGQTLADLLSAQGLGPREIHRLVSRVREYQLPRHLRPGARLELKREPLVGDVRKLDLRLDRDRSLELTRRDGEWEASLDSVAVRTDTIVVAGLIRSSLFDAHLSGDTARLAPNEETEIAHEVARIFQWRIDFFRDLRSGDAYRIAVRRKVRPDGTLRSARVLGVEFRNGSRHLWAVHYDSPDPSVDGYYALDGKSLRTRFLRAPLRYRRVTSGFSRSRYHPVLERRRAHLGIDYGAATGTPVRTTGDGVVTKVRRWGGYGRMVEVRHAGPYRTRYAHMRSFASGLDVGDRVTQGEVIGRVGASGTATGPHLHYEFMKRGEQVDPSSLRLPPEEPVPGSEMGRFERQRDATVRVLSRLRLPRVSRLASRDGSVDGDEAGR